MKLYGVVAPGSLSLFGRIHFGEITLKPSRGLLDYLANTSPAKVGIEWFSREDKMRLDAAADSEGLMMPDVPYWSWITDACAKAGHEIVFMDSGNLFFEHFEALSKLREIKRFFRENFCHPAGESEVNYHRRLCNANEKKHLAELKSRRIHELMRGEHLLRQLNGLDIAIVSAGFSDYWIAKNIVQAEYSKDVPSGKSNRLVKNAKPNPKIAFLQTGLERALRLAETGTITGETPDYVGTWEYVCPPSRGYFEMFIERSADSMVCGTIEDCLGSARFKGELNDDGFNFTKVYDKKNSVRGASITPVKYELKKVGGMLFGYYSAHGLGGPVAMVKAPKADPVDLAVAWRVEEKKKNPA